MYTVNIINNGVTTTIHDGFGADLSAPKIKGGKIVNAINSIDSFEFTIYPNNPGYDLINGMRTKVEVIDRNGKAKFKGRVLKPSPSMDAAGMICKTVLCEGRMGWLCDSVQPYGEYTVPSINSVLNNFLMVHNYQAGDDKRIELGQVTVTASNDYHYTKNWETTMQTISDKLIGKFGGEIQLRDGSDGKVYLDYLDRIGHGTDTKIELSVNLKTITQEIDETSVITRLYPLGAKQNDSEARLTVASVNNGFPFIDDDNLVAKYGVISGTQTWDDVTTAASLLSKGKAYLKNVNKVKKQYTITALDLSTINADFEEFELGNIHRVVNPLMGIDEELRIIGITINLDSPQASELTFGDKFETMTGFVTKKTQAIAQAIDESEFRNRTIVNEKIENATQLITGAQGGHVILDPSEKPERILIMDTANIDTCKSCIQLNKNGIGFWNEAKNGGSAKTGPYTNAWTIDGNLVASFITALQLTGLKINNGNGKFVVSEDGDVTMRSATITNGSINCGGKFIADSAGNVTANSLKSNNATITGGSINIVTSKNDADIIKLSNNEWAIEMSPLQWILTNSSTNCKILCQAGCMYFYNSEKLMCYIVTETGDIATGGRISCSGIGSSGDITCKASTSGKSYLVGDAIHYLYGKVDELERKIGG